MTPDGTYEVHDGQQRITGFGLFVKENFFVVINGTRQCFSGLDEDPCKKMLSG